MSARKRFFRQIASGATAVSALRGMDEEQKQRGRNATDLTFQDIVMSVMHKERRLLQL